MEFSGVLDGISMNSLQNVVAAFFKQSEVIGNAEWKTNAWKKKKKMRLSEQPLPQNMGKYGKLWKLVILP